MKRIAIGGLAILLAGLTTPAQAELSIYVQDTNVAVGGYALVNVYLTGLSTDTFNNYSVELDITPKAGTSGTLVFAANASDPSVATSTQQTYSYLYPSTASNYIFNNDSIDAMGPSNGGSPVGSSPGPDFNVADQSFNSLFTPTTYAPMGDSLSANPADNTLLASLKIWAESTSVNDQYQMTVNVANSIFNTYDPTANGGMGGYVNPLTFGSGSTTGYSGTITVGGASVPEPSSIISGLTAVLLLAGWHGARRLRKSYARGAPPQPIRGVAGRATFTPASLCY